MEKVFDLIKAQPSWIVIGAGAVLIIVAAACIVLISRAVKLSRFRKILLSYRDDSQPKPDLPSPGPFLKRTRQIVRFVRKHGPEILELTGIDQLWLKRLLDKKRAADLKRVIEFLPSRGLFVSLTVALETPKLRKVVMDRIGDEPGSLRAMALSGSGESFDGSLALGLFSSRLDEIREIAGDPEWAARYFAVKLMVHDTSDKSERALLEAYLDPHPLVRKTVAEEFIAQDSNLQYEKLRNLLLHDPSFEVRKSAYERIRKDFDDQHRITFEQLEGDEALHVLDFLDPLSDDDVDTALKLLKGKDLERRLPAALFLQNHGILLRLLTEVHLQDREDLNRTLNLLKNAAAVQVTDYLGIVPAGHASVYLGLKILETCGNRSLIHRYAEKAFSAKGDYAQEIWETAVDTICKKGTEDAFRLLMRELGQVRSLPEKAGYILKLLPGDYSFITLNTLMELLKDERFESRDELKEAFSRIEPAVVLPQIFEVLKGGRQEFAHRTRITALQVLAWYRLPYCIQPVLELLPVLPLEESRKFASILAEYGGKEFDKRISHLLSQPDGRTRAAVISSLPGTSKKEFIKDIRTALKDAEPDIRIASLWALTEFEDVKTVNQSFEMLRDPVERVREAAARALGSFGSAVLVKKFDDVLLDEHEVLSVKHAAIKGLGASSHNEAVDVLVKIMDQVPELEQAATNELARQKSKKSLARLVEQMKDAEPTLRDKIATVFKRMGEESETAVRELLQEDIPSLKDYLVEILDSTGYTESVIRKLSHRDPDIRRDAADFLSLVGSKAAFRGIVLAARDPDDEVRVKVTKALEILNSPSGKEILEDLKNDPERRIRKYTLWALERMKAKSLED